MGLKDKMMDSAMDKMFSSMTAEERQNMMEQMMDKFFSSMSDEEKKEMMSSMMQKMMGGGEAPGKGMFAMMQGMMGGEEDGSDGFNPMDMCQQMMGSMKKNTDVAQTEELQTLFNEWLEQIEGEAFRFLNEQKDFSVEECAIKLHLSQESARIIINRLISKGKLNVRYKSEAKTEKGEEKNG
jgi:predicted HTH transcriptional regulator